MYKYNNAKVAKESAQEKNLHYGMSALDGKWYVGSVEELKKAGCANIDKSEGKMSKALEIVKMIKEDEEELTGGFAINTSDEKVIEDNFRDRRGREPNGKEWEQIGKDLMKIESNAVKYLKKVLGNASDEGHNSSGDLLGSFWCDWSNKKGLETVFAHHEESDPNELSSEEDSALFNGVSKEGLDGVNVSIYFFAIDPDDLEQLIAEVENE